MLFNPEIRKIRNPALREIYLNGQPQGKIKDAIDRIGRLSQAMKEGSAYIYERVFQQVFHEYDERFGSDILAKMSPERRKRMERRIVDYLLVCVFREMTQIAGDPAAGSLFTDAIHFEIFGAPPGADGSFIDFLTYENPNLEDPKSAPVFKFGHEMSQMTGTIDMSFPLVMAQQSAIVLELGKRLVRFALFDEPIDGGGK